METARPVVVKFHNAIALGILDPVAENRGPLILLTGAISSARKPMAIEHVIAENQADGFPCR